MAAHPDTVTRTIGGKTYTISLQDVQAAAARLRPLHEADLAQRELYVLVGTGLHYAADLIAEVTSAPPSTAARHTTCSASSAPNCSAGTGAI